MKRKMLARANHISLAIILLMLIAGFVLLVTASVSWLFSGILIDSEDTEFSGS